MEPKFTWKQPVKITKGFFKGQIGIVHKIKYRLPFCDFRYIVYIRGLGYDFNSSMRTFKENSLEAAHAEEKT